MVRRQSSSETLFGVGGGGLAGKRVRERWKGVEEFSFIEVGAGSRATREEIEDLREARKRIQSGNAEKKEKQDSNVEEKEKIEKEVEESTTKQETPDAPVEPAEGETETSSDEPGEDSVADSEVIGEDRQELEQRLLNLSLAAGTRSSVSEGIAARPSTDSIRPTLDQAHDDGHTPKTAPSLTVRITCSYIFAFKLIHFRLRWSSLASWSSQRLKRITAWRSICSSGSIVTAGELAASAAIPDGQSSTISRESRSTRIQSKSKKIQRYRRRLRPPRTNLYMCPHLPRAPTWS